MGLVDIWLSSPDQLRDKHVQQVIAFAGEGKLRDGNATSSEFRALLTHVPSAILARYAEESLNTRFEGNGFALQDVVNEVGRRLGFSVKNGRYRGVLGGNGYDGLWLADEWALVVEVKSTDAYKIDLDKIAGYRRFLIRSGEIAEDSSSVLLVVGNEDTGSLEAQIRGSRQAWDFRLISVSALIRLMKIKETIEDPVTANRIRQVLIPQEFTKVDRIIDLVFATAEDVFEPLGRFC
ncbi:MAG: hypothetical protein ACOYU7_01150 [Bacillota bacterium]